MAKIKSIKVIPNKYKLDAHRERIRVSHVYDIEVEGNHNYLANDLLVSNSGAETYREVNLKHLKNAYYRIGLTATNFRNDGADMALESVLSEVLYEYSISQAIADGFLIKPDFKIIQNQVRADSTYQKEYKSGIVENKERNELIASLVDQKANTIILVQQLEHGEALKELIPNSTFIHGQESDTIREKALEDFRKGKINILIGTSVIGEGVDLPIANTLILAGGGKARSQVMQNIGRVLRICPGKTKALVIDFKDTGASWLADHSLERQEIYKIYT
jgi:superfamily II DNA or RNA helicase